MRQIRLHKCTFANSEDPEEMPNFATFLLDLHCLLRQKCSSEVEIEYYFEIITCDLAIYTMGHPDLTY